MELSEIWGNEAKPTELVAAGQPQQTRVWSSRAEARWILGATHVDLLWLTRHWFVWKAILIENMIIIHWNWGFPLNFQTNTHCWMISKFESVEPGLQLCAFVRYCISALISSHCAGSCYAKAIAAELGSGEKRSLFPIDCSFGASLLKWKRLI